MSSDLVTKSGEHIRKGRIRPALATAVRLIVEEGLSQVDAAQRVEMRQESLSVALRKPHVKAFKAAVKHAWLNSETDKAWLTVTKLASGAASEDVKLKAAKVLLEAAGELRDGKATDARGPGSMVQINVQHVTQADQPISHRLPGVIEYQAPQRVKPDPSNLLPVGRSSTATDQP